MFFATALEYAIGRVEENKEGMNWIGRAIFWSKLVMLI
jgi:hypothetical protein